MGTREQPACHRADLLTYAKRPLANVNPYTHTTHFRQALDYHGARTQGLARVYRMARARHLSATCGLGCWPFLMAGPVGSLP